MRILYLDFDGVLHPASVYWHHKRGIYLEQPPGRTGHELFEHAPLLAELLRPWQDVRIVLSTSWVREVRYSNARARLPIELQEKCIGATFHTEMDEYSFEALLRGGQVRADASRRRISGWLALDDNPGGWDGLRDATWVQTDEVHGMNTSKVLKALQAWLLRG